MDSLTLLALAGGGLAAGYCLALATGRLPRASVGPIAALCGLFAAYTLACVVTEGPIGFWWEHTDSLWGVQVWLDLLLGIGTALTLMVPLARAAGMRVLPWVMLTLATGSIGLLAMAARLVWLQTRAAEG